MNTADIKRKVSELQEKVCTDEIERKFYFVAGQIRKDMPKLTADMVSRANSDAVISYVLLAADLIDQHEKLEFLADIVDTDVAFSLKWWFIKLFKKVSKESASKDWELDDNDALLLRELMLVYL
jgi:hypothetical protein